MYQPTIRLLDHLYQALDEPPVSENSHEGVSSLSLNMVIHLFTYTPSSWFYTTQTFNQKLEVCVHHNPGTKYIVYKKTW